MSLSLAWVVPGGSDTNIARFSRAVLDALARRASSWDLRVCCLLTGPGNGFATTVPVLPLDRPDRLAAFDLALFNIDGTDPTVTLTALQVPGILILHELALLRPLSRHLLASPGGSAGLARLLGEYHGISALDVLATSRLGRDPEPVYRPWDTTHVQRMPLLEPLLSTAAGAIVHSHHAEQLVRPARDLPLLRLALPFQAARQVSESDDSGADHRICTILAGGEISADRQLPVVLDVFAQSPLLRRAARLVIAGAAPDAGLLRDLREQVTRLGLEQSAAILPNPAPGELRRLRGMADLVLELRHPIREAAALDVLDAAASGRAVVVTPGGPMADWPADTVLQARREEGGQGLAAILEQAVTDPVWRARIGAAGRAHAREMQADAYAERLVGFIGAHHDMFRARGAAASWPGVPAVEDLPEAAGAAWRTRAALARRVVAAAAREAIDAAVFRDWPEPKLLRFIAAGVFGLEGGGGERLAQRWLHRLGRVGLLRAVAQARDLSLRGEAGPIGGPVLDVPPYALLAGGEPAMLARALIAGLFCRAPRDEAELPELVARMERQGVGRTVADMVATSAFRAQPVDPAALDRLLREAEAITLPGATPPDLGLGLRPMSNRDPLCPGFLVAGWHGLEEGGVWSRGGLAILALRVPDAPEQSRLMLRLTTRFPLASEGRPRVLRVVGGGAAATRHETQGEGWSTVQVALPGRSVLRAGCEVALDSGPPVNLRAEGVSDDPRDLGVRLRSLELLEAAIE